MTIRTGSAATGPLGQTIPSRKLALRAGRTRRVSSIPPSFRRRPDDQNFFEICLSCSICEPGTPGVPAGQGIRNDGVAVPHGVDTVARPLMARPVRVVG